MPLGAMSNLLGFPIHVDPKQGGADGSLVNENQIFSLNVSLGIFIINGVVKTIPPNLIIATDTEIYVDISLLGFMLPIKFSFDDTRNRVSVIPEHSLSQIDQEKLTSRWSRIVPKNEIVSPVYDTKVIRITPEEEALPPKQSEPSTEEKPKPPLVVKERPVVPSPPLSPAPAPPPPPLSPSPEVPLETPSIVPLEKKPKAVLQKAEETPQEEEKNVKKASDGELIEDNLLVLQLDLEEVVYDEFIEAYSIRNHYFLPLGNLTQLLQLAIAVDPLSGKASGWFIKKSRTFELDIAKGRVSISGKSQDIPEGAVLKNGSDIYVDSKLLSAWLPIDFQVNTSLLTLKMKAKEPLPQQLKQLRNKHWEQAKNNERKESNYPKIPIPYEKTALPFIDVSIGHNYTTAESTNKNTFDYSLRSGGDFGYLSTQSFISGGSDGVRRVRLAAARKDNSSTLLGPLKATGFSVGDINVNAIPLVAESGEGRGFTVSNRLLTLPTQFDSTEFVGNDLPGWDVELYRNGALIGFQQIGGDGRYQFTNIPILYGNNTFRLVFYGPQGQIREEVKRVVAADTLLKKGKTNYLFSMDQKAESLVAAGDPLTGRKELRAISVVDYGVTNNLTVSVGALQTPLAEGMEQYATTGIIAGLPGGVLARSDFAYDITGKKAAGRISSLASFLGMSLKGEYRKFQKGYMSEEFEKGEGAISDSIELDINTPLPLLPNLSTGANFHKDNFQSGPKQTLLTGRVSGSFWGTVLTNNMGIRELSDENQKNRTIVGDVAASTIIKSVALRSSANYTLPDKKLQSFALTAQKRLNDRLIAAIGFNKNLTEDNRSILSGSLNWDVRYAKLSFRADIDSDNQVTVGTNINFALGKDPRTGKWHVQSQGMADVGAISAKAFLDKNYNGVFDTDEEWVKEIGIRMGSSRFIKSDEEGIVFGTGLPANMPSAISFEEATLKDPLWIVETPNYSLTSRPGVVTKVDFPIVATSEIDGTVLLQMPNALQPLSGIEVQLVNQKGDVVGKARSEFDGFFVIERVKPGDYTMQVAPSILAARKLTAAPIRIVTTGESNVFSDQKLILSPRGGEILTTEVTAESNTTQQTAPIENVTLPTSAKPVYAELGAFQTKELAEKERNILLENNKNLLTASTLAVEDVWIEEDRSTIYKLVVHNQTEQEYAHLCAALEKQQQSCFVVKE